MACAGGRMALGHGALVIGMLGAVDLRLVAGDVGDATGIPGFEGHGYHGFRDGDQLALSMREGRDASGAAGREDADGRLRKGQA